MRIKIMLLLTSMALATVASISSAVAEAQTHGLTDPPGTFIKNGGGVTLTSTNLISHTALGTPTCEKVTLHYTVETNTDEHVSLEPVNVGGVETTNATTQNCVLHTGGPTGATHTIDVTRAGTDTVTFNTWGTAQAAWSWTMKITFAGGGSVQCTFSGNVHLKASNGSSTLAVGKSTLNGGLCGNGEIGGTASIETSDGVEIIEDIRPT